MFMERRSSNLSHYLKSLMHTVELKHQAVLDCAQQLQVLKVPQMDGPKDLRTRMDPLVSLKVGRITEAVEKEAALVQAALDKLTKAYVLVNATGVSIPVLTLMGAKVSETCKHMTDGLAPDATPGTHEWVCGECGQRFMPDYRAHMLHDPVEFHKKRVEYLAEHTTVSTVRLTADDVKKFPDVAPGIMQALSPFIVEEV